MSVYSGIGSSESGSIFEYDIANIQKSWKGRPTTNYFYNQNARSDSSYASYSATSLGTWNAKHPDAIRVYNDDGNEITAYVNSGVTDWTNTHHAVWIYDTELQRPVVIMRDRDGAWKAKSWNTGQSMTTMGLAAGSTYTISWLQWTSNIATSANVGLYGKDTNAVWNFWDGLSSSQTSTSYNTKPYTWQRVYATFTVSSVRDMTAGLNCYMYGHSGNRSTLKIADVQLEVGSVASAFTKSQTRTNVQGLLDTTGGDVITLNSLTYASNSGFSFNGTSDYITVAAASTWAIGQNGTVEQWVRIAGNSGTNNRFWCTTNAASGLDAYLAGGSYNIGLHGGTVSTTSTIPSNQWVHLVVTYTAGTIRVYFNGVEQPLTGTTTGYNITNTGPLFIGQYSGGGNYFFNGKIDVMQVYSRALSSSEIRQNFNALRSRFGV